MVNSTSIFRKVQFKHSMEGCSDFVYILYFEYDLVLIFKMSLFCFPFLINKHTHTRSVNTHTRTKTLLNIFMSFECP